MCSLLALDSPTVCDVGRMKDPHMMEHLDIFQEEIPHSHGVALKRLEHDMDTVGRSEEQLDGLACFSKGVPLLESMFYFSVPDSCL